MTKRLLSRGFGARHPAGPRDPDHAPPVRRRRKRLRRLTVTMGVLAVIAVALVANMILINVQAASSGPTGTVQTDGTSLYVRQDGPPTAPDLVLLHGLGGSIHWWDSITPALAKSYHVIRIDLLGHGRSAKPGGDRYAIPAQAELVGDVLGRLGVTQAVVIGHSTGGYVATSLAEQRPRLVAALVLIDTGPSMSAYISGGIAGNLLTTPVIGQLIWRLRTGSLLRKAMSSAFSRPGYQIPQQLVDDLNGMTYHALTATSHASDVYIEQEPMPQRLAHLAKPVLVLYGADDHRWHPASYARYDTTPGVRVEAVPDAGHSPMLEYPARTSSLIFSFLKSTPAQ